MKSLKLILAPVLALGMGLSACAGTAYVVTDEPPPPREEVVTYRPGHVWVEGHWVRSGNRWAWNDGYYVRERPSQVYVSGRWEHRNDQYVWVNGGFRARGTAGVAVRDHRR